MDHKKKVEKLKCEFPHINSDCLEDILSTLDNEYHITRQMVKELFPLEAGGGGSGPSDDLNFSESSNIFLEISPDIFTRLHGNFATTTKTNCNLAQMEKEFETCGSIFLPLERNVAMAIYLNIINYVKQSNDLLPDLEGSNCTINPMEFISLDSMANYESSSLKEIMELELVKQNSRNEYVAGLLKRIQLGDRDFALKQEFFVEKKRDFLFTKFPGIVASMVDKLYEINCYDLKETIKDIEAFYNFKLPSYYKHSLYSEVTKRTLEDQFESQSPTTDTEDEDESSEGGSVANESEFKSSINNLIEQRSILHLKIAHLQPKKIRFYREQQLDVALMYQVEVNKSRAKLIQLSDELIDTFVKYHFPNDEIDLHGLILREVARIIPRILTAKQRRLIQAGHNKSKFKIITGIGGNGGDFGAIRKYIGNFLHKHSIKHDPDGPGAFITTITSRSIFNFN